MSFVAAGIAGGASALGGIGGALISANATENAAQTQAAAANQASLLQYQEFQTQQANEQPWMASGTSALSQMQGLTANAPSFTMQDFYNNQDPAYQFDLEQGQQAIQRSAAATGSLQSGGTLKDLSNYAQGQASNEYQNAYNRYMNNQNTQFNRLASIAGTGQTATSNINAAGMNMANNVGNNIMGAANASAGAQTAVGQQWGSTLSNLGSGVGNTWMSANTLNRILGPGGVGVNGVNMGIGSGGGSIPSTFTPADTGAPSLGSFNYYAS